MISECIMRFLSSSQPSCKLNYSTFGVKWIVCWKHHGCAWKCTSISTRSLERFSTNWPWWIWPLTDIMSMIIRQRRKFVDWTREQLEVNQNFDVMTPIFGWMDIWSSNQWIQNIPLPNISWESHYLVPIFVWRNHTSVRFPTRKLICIVIPVKYPSTASDTDRW